MKEEIEWHPMSCHEDRDMPANGSPVLLKLSWDQMQTAYYKNGLWYEYPGISNMEPDQEIDEYEDQIAPFVIKAWAYMPKGPQ